jgi:hypothetical protein
VAGFFFVL